MKLLLDKLSEIQANSSNNKRRKTAALMTHVVLGYPTLKQSIDIVLAMEQSGASLIELQIPIL